MSVGTSLWPLVEQVGKAAGRRSIAAAVEAALQLAAESIRDV